MRKLTQALALSAVACSTFASTTPAFAARSAALDGVNSSTILNSSAVANGNSTDGYASGKSQAGVAFEEGSLYLYGNPNFNFGTHIWSADKTWDLLPSGAANSSGTVTKQNDIKANSIAVGDFRSYNKRGWSLNVNVTKFVNVKNSKEVQPIRAMIFHHASLMNGKFNVPVSDEAIQKSMFDFHDAHDSQGNLPSDAPANILGSDSHPDISVVPKGDYGSPVKGNEAVIWNANPGDVNDPSNPVQGKSVWGLSFVDKGDVQLIPVNQIDQLPGDYRAQLTWTLSTTPLP